MKQKKQRTWTLLLLALLLPLVAQARTVWTGSQELDWNNSKYQSIDASTLGTVSAGDRIVVTYTAAASAQIQLNGLGGGWTGVETKSVAEGSTTATFYVTAPSLTTINGGIAISGVNATLTQVDVEDNDGGDYTNSVWIGEETIAKDWSNWLNVSKTAFSNAVENYYIRFKFKDLLSGAQFGLQYNNGTSWETMPGVSNVAISGLYQQYTISSEMLTALKTYGCIVRGGGYTLTAIDIIDPSSLKTLTLSVASDETNSNWVYTTTSPKIKIGVQNANGEAVTANAVVRLYTDAYATYKTANVSQSVAANSTQTLEVSFSDVAPGFYRVYATVNDEMAHSAFIIGVNPTSIVSAADKQNDFDSFWQTAKTQLATIEASDTPTLIELNGENGTANKSTAARKVYLVEFKSIPDGASGEGVTIRGYYCEPTDNSKTYPVIMHYLGYDSAYAPGGTDHKPYCPSGDANPGYAEFYLSTRGQSLNNRASDEREADGRSEAYTNTYGDWFAYNFGDKDSYYYRGAYMDCVRAIDFMASRATSDMDNLFAEGQSQGGAFTYAAAALSGRTFKAIAPAIPFMGDFPDYFQVGNWPASVATANKGEMTDSEMYAFLSYFDTKNLATMISCPVITSIGLQDNVCPPHTNIAPYNNVTTAAADKQIVFNPELQHQVNGQWFTIYNTFFQNYEVNANGEHVTTLIDVSDSPVEINWSKEDSKTVAASAFANAKAGDYILLTVVGTGNMQCTIRNSSSTSVINTDYYTRNNVTEERTIRFGLTEAGLAEVQAGGIYVVGTYCNLKKIELVSPSIPEDVSDAIFFGDRYSSYNGVQLRKANFTAAQKGWTLRVHHKDLQTTHKMSLRTAWNTIITGYDYADVTGDYTDYTIDDAIYTAMTESDNILIYGQSLTITKIELFNPIKTLSVETVLYEGTTPLTNWKKNYEQPTSIINSLKEGDVLKVTVSQQGETTTYPQLYITWDSNDNTNGRVGWQCNSYGAPYTYELTLTADQVTAIQTAGKLYLNGCNITVSKWTLTQQKTVSRERGNAATTVWTGSEVVSWNPGDGNNSPQIAASAFANAATGMKVRVNFSSMKLGAQGRIIKSGYGTFDGVATKKLPTECGDYFEYAISSDMLTELKNNGMRINGVGYTATSVELIDPMKEYVINATFDSDDIIAWEPSQGTPNLSVTLTNYEEESVTTTISASLMTDMFADYNNYSQNVTLAAGETKTVDLEFSDLQPGFYRMAAKANNNMLCTYYIGYNPTAIVSPDDSQDDFAEFWGNWKARLANIPINATLTLLNGDTESDTRNIYEVSYQSVPETVDGDPVTIYGYYAEPKAAGTYPCIIHFHGTDKSGSLTMPSGTTEGWCEFRFSARGQTLDKAKNGSVKYRTDADDESSVDFYAYQLGSNDNHYYRYVYLDTRRAVDFVFSQAKVNKDAVFAAGGSQGGCLTYVCAALSDGKIRAIAPSITGHADFVHTMEIVGWPTNVFNNWINAKVADGTYANYDDGKAALLAHQSYFDTKNFAKWIYCPVITNFSLQDNTDGPHLNISPYNLLTNVAAADKQYSINQFKGHAAADNWSTTYMAFFNQYLNTPLTIPYALTVSDPGYATYYNSTATQLPSGVEAATIDAANNSENALTVNWCYNGDENEKKVIPGGTAVMVKATAGNYNLSLLPSNTTAAPTGNLLHGSDVSTTTTGGDKYYKLTYGKADGSNANNFGWYWGAADGAAFTMPAHKAWLALSSGAGTRSYFSLDGGDGTTGIGTIETKLDPDTLPEEGWYDLRGQRINKPTQKGLYILNGKKIIVR